jgi:hypothetical protein
MSTEANADSLLQRISYGPGMRWQRLTEGVLLVTALLTQDVRWAFPALVSVLLQIVSVRLALVTLLVALVYRPPPEKRVDGFYFDATANRGGAVISATIQSLAIYLVLAGFPIPGWLLLALPAGSFLLSPTVGFCAGCILFVQVRLLAARLGWVSRTVRGSVDVEFD